MVTPILTTKLHIPSLRSNLVPRERLLERLDQGLHSKLILVSAPAGFGKTTLLCEWIQGLQANGSPSVKVAWISLDDGDNDPARFSAYMAAALQRVDASIGRVDADALELTGSLLQEPHLVQWINQIAGKPQALVLVLDDYHLIVSQVIHDAVAFLVDHLSENLHIVLATRADPPLPLPRLRARGHLTELRQIDLRFTPQEAAELLNNVMGLSLSADDVAALEARTEGWIAGLQMAALSLQGKSPDPASRSGFIQDFTGSHRFILDYLVEEVLDLQPPAVQRFLLRTSILERLIGPLCDALVWNSDVGGADAPPDTSMRRFSTSQSVLEHLEAANLFIVPLDEERHWYRYHRLFRDLLRKRLWQMSPDLVLELHRRASAWHEVEGLVGAAIDHALVARDFERAATLIEGSVEATLMRSEIATFLNWMGKLPEASVRARPTLCFFHAWALLMSGQSLNAVEQRLQDVACGQDAPESTGVMAGRLAAFRAYLVLFQADTHRAAELGRQALDCLPESDRFLRAVATWILSLTRLAGEGTQDSKQTLEDVARMGQEMGNPLIAVTALCHQARLRARQGRLHRAYELLEQALQLATDPQGRRLPVASKALIGLGELEREWNDLEMAVDHLTEGIRLAAQWSTLAAFDAYFPLARIKLAQGDVEAAREAVETAQRIAHRSEATEVDDHVAELQRAYLSAIVGDTAQAERWAEARRSSPGISAGRKSGLDRSRRLLAAHLWKYERLVVARLLILKGQTAQALDLLDSLLPLVRRDGRIDLTIEIQILKALACRGEGRDTEAADALGEALSLAEPGGYVRIFLDEGEPMASLLRQIASPGVAPAYVKKLLEAFGMPDPARVESETRQRQALIEPLSERELEVLRLLATGMSNPEIADELVIAVSTVRSHCKSIYGKLNVHSRWDAVQRGGELGLV